jgi:copper homeostasis protein
VQLEIAVQDVAGARIASHAGADRVELCSALSLGGVTPSAGVIEAVLAASSCPVHVLVRPRPGDFRYSPDEVDTLLADVRLAIAAGAHGVVVGALNDRAGVDEVVLDRVLDAAGAADVTFHRAFDLVVDAGAALDRLAARGVRRVLTSGGASSAVAGVAGIGRIVGLAAGRVQIMAGGGVTLESIPVLASVGVDAVHLSAKRERQVPGGFSLGSDSTEGVMRWDETDAELVARARAAVSGSS